MATPNIFTGRMFQNSQNFGNNIIKRDVTKELIEIKTKQAPLLQLVNRHGTKSSPTRTIDYEQYMQRMIPVSCRVTEAAAAADTTIKVDPSTAASLTPQTLLHNLNTKETLEVVSRVTSTGVVTVKRAVGVADEAGTLIPAAPITETHTFVLLPTLIKEGVGTQESYAAVPEHSFNNIGMYQTDLDLTELAITQALYAGDTKTLENQRYILSRQGDEKALVEEKKPLRPHAA